MNTIDLKNEAIAVLRSIMNHGSTQERLAAIQALINMGAI